MKFRIIRKKLKKDALLNLWIKSFKDWEIVLNNIRSKYLIIYNIDNIDSSSYTVGCDMIKFDYRNILKRGEQLGFRHKIINKYLNEIKEYEPDIRTIYSW